MKKNLALDFLMSRPWALDQGYLDIMTGLSARDLDNLDLSSLKLSANQVAESVATALEGKSGRAVTRGMEIRGDVAIIHVNGVISRYAGMFDDICGGTSTQNLAKDWTAATERHDVNSIVLYIDSPGVMPTAFMSLPKWFTKAAVINMSLPMLAAVLAAPLIG
ncbi:hypothetical protein HT094_21955 [Shewanella sp. ZOR0012]|nr:hypothetical protein [Shewanella sp. ZOR0012]